MATTTVPTWAASTAWSKGPEWWSTHTGPRATHNHPKVVTVWDPTIPVTTDALGRLPGASEALRVYEAQQTIARFDTLVKQIIAGGIVGGVVLLAATLFFYFRIIRPLRKEHARLDIRYGRALHPRGASQDMLPNPNRITKKESRYRTASKVPFYGTIGTNAAVLPLIAAADVTAGSTEISVAPALGSYTVTKTMGGVQPPNLKSLQEQAAKVTRHLALTASVVGAFALVSLVLFLACCIWWLRRGRFMRKAVLELRERDRLAEEKDDGESFFG